MTDKCTACELADIGMSNCIKGRGNAHGGIFIVGQNPNGTDDLESTPFGGRTGQILNEMLSNAGYPQEDVRFSFAVRCRTPDRDRQPFRSEVEACRQHLKAEIATMQPTAIVALGDTALQALTKKSGIKNYRGLEVPLHPEFGYVCSVWPTYAPTAVFNPTQAPLRATIVKDLLRARTGFGEPDHVEWEWWAGQSFIGETLLSFDIETDFLHGGKGDVCQIQVSTEEKNYVARGFDDVFDCVVALKAAGDAGATLVGHNQWKFDNHEIAKQVGIDLPFGEDTMALAYLDDETQPLALEALCVKYLGVRGWKTGIEAPLDSNEFAEYGARDSYYTRQLRMKLVERLGERRKIHDIIMRPMRRVLDDCTRRGIKINLESVQERFNANTLRLAELRATINAEAVGPINPNSPAQVAMILEAEGHRLPASRKTGKPSASIGVLNDLEKTPLVEAIIDYRGLNKQQTGAIVPYLKIAQEGDGRTHSNFDIWRTLTGRTNAKDKNIQQLDRDLRDIFEASEGYELTSADYSAVEFWVAAFVAGAQSIIANKIANPLWDPHTYFASIFYGVSEDEVNADRKNPNGKRQVAKSANFSQLYLGNANTIREYAKKMGIRLSMEECVRLHNAWHQAFPEFNGGGSPYGKGFNTQLGGWYAQVWRELQSTGQAQTITGFIRHFGRFGDLPIKAQLDALRQATNAKVQGPAAHIAFIGGAALRRAKFPLNGFFHDAWMMELLEGTSQKREAEIVYALCDVPIRVLRKHFGVELPRELLGVEIKVQQRKDII